MKQQLRCIVLCVIVLIVDSHGALTDKIDPVTLDVIPEEQDMLYNRAPDPLPWIPPEMLETSYWIGKMEKPDEIILFLDKIERMNKAYEEEIHSPYPFNDVSNELKPNLIHWWPGFSLAVWDFYSMDSRAVADSVKNRIKDEIAYLRKQEYANVQAVKYSAKQIDDFEKEMAFEQIQDRVTPRAGITVRTSRLRNVPSFLPEQFGMTQAGKMRWDMWNIGVVKIGKPLTILHLSKSGEYTFVLCENGYGWLRSEDIALGTKKEIDNFVNTSDFIVCTGDRVQFYTDESCTCASGWFGMSAKLPLASKSNPRMIKVPVRRMNGQFTTETAWVKNDNNVHVGWLPYTRRNIIETAFKLLGNPYDWSGAWFGRQHESTYRDIFGCFGFNLPIHGSLFCLYGNCTKVLHPEMGKEIYYREILNNEPFVTIQSCGGHCQLFIGEHNGNPIVFDQHGYNYEGEDGKTYEVRRCNIGDLRLPIYFLKRDVTFLILK